MQGSHVLLILVAVIACILSIALLSAEIWVVSKKEHRQSTGVRKVAIVRFSSSKRNHELKSVVGLQRALELIPYVLPSQGYRHHLEFLHASISTLADNAVLRLVVDCVTVMLRKQAHVSSRNLYLRSIDFYHRQPLIKTNSDAPRRLTLPCQNVTALVLVGLQGNITMTYSRSKESHVVNVNKLDVILAGLNHRDSKPVSVDVETDLLVLQFSTIVCLV